MLLHRLTLTTCVVLAAGLVPSLASESDASWHPLPQQSAAQQEGNQADPAQSFNFWIGEWDTTASNTPTWQENHGKDVVSSHLNGRLIEEVFTRNADGQNFQRGYLFYLRREKKWQHIIYDVSWGEYRFLGGPTTNAAGEPVIVLESPDDDSRPGKRRETFSKITKDSFEYLWEESADGGKTWQAMWKVKYQRAQDAEK